jgi:hypothetical protein
MNILDMMNKLTALSQVNESDDKEETTTHKGGTKTVDSKGVKHKGKYGTDYQGDEDDEKTDDYGKKKKAPAVTKAEPAAKRGRGRPAKNADKDGNVMKPLWSAFGAKKDVKLKPWDKKATTKHSLKDWIENLDKALNEASPAPLITKPVNGAVQIMGADNKPIGMADAATAAVMTNAAKKGTFSMDNAKSVNEVGNNDWSAPRDPNKIPKKPTMDSGIIALKLKQGMPAEKIAKLYGIDVNKVKQVEIQMTRQMSEAKKAKPDFLNKDKDGNKKSTKDAADSKYDVSAGKRNAKDDLKARNDKKQPVKEGRVKELSMDLDDRTMKDAEFKKKYGKTKAEMQKSLKAPAKKPVSKIKESILRESHETMKHIINKFKHEVKNFVNGGGDLDQDLYEALYDYYCDQGEMPYGTMKARDGDPYEWVANRFDRDVQGHDIPGQDMVDEAAFPVFNEPAATRKAAGRDFPVSMDQVNHNDSLSHLPNLRTAGAKLGTSPWDAAPAGDVQFEGWAKDLNNMLNEGMNVVANTGLGDGPDSVTISATEEDATALLQLVKSAGLGMFAGDETAAPADQGQPGAVAVDGQDGQIDVVDDHDDMLSIMRKLSGQSDAAPAMATPVDESGACPTCGASQCDEDHMAGEAPADEQDVQQATEKLEKVHAAWSEVDDQAPAEDEVDEEVDDMDDNEESDDDHTDEDGYRADDKREPYEKTHSEDEVDESSNDEDEHDASGNLKKNGGFDAAGHKTSKGAENDADQADYEKDEEKVEEGYANDADDKFNADIDFMQNVISGGMNGRKRSQSVGNPVTIASTPMKESTDLLSDWKKLAGF